MAKISKGRVNKKGTGKGKRILITALIFSAIGTVVIYDIKTFLPTNNKDTIDDITSAVVSAGNSVSPPRSPEIPHRPPKCTPKQRSQILKQLTPDRCNKAHQPWFQKCSFTLATKCPDTTWIDSHYESIHSNTKKGTAPAPNSSAFVAVYVGCNKGYDAVNSLRMGTGNSKYNKKAWESKMGETHESVCQPSMLL